MDCSRLLRDGDQRLLDRFAVLQGRLDQVENGARPLRAAHGQ